MKTAMREAFENAKVVKSKTGLKLADKVIKELDTKAGQLHETRGWKANLHPATVKSLVHAGVFG